MDTKELLNYLGIVLDLEKNMYIQRGTLYAIKSEINKCENTITRNEMANLESQNKGARVLINKENIPVDQSGKWWAYLFVYWFGIMGAMLFGGISSLIIGEGSFLAVIFGVLGAIVAGSIPWRMWKNTLKKRKEEHIRHIARLENADFAAAKNRSVDSQNMRLEIPKLQEKYNQMEKTYNNTRRTLKACYDLGVIPIKYRSFMPVCMFYDYILNKRTYSLERNPVTADEGAINMYEHEVKMGIIISKLDEAISVLKSIRAQQAVFCEQMLEAQNRQHELMQSINDNITGFRSDVNKGLDIITYQNEQIKNCQNYMSYVTYQRFGSRY